MAQAPTPTAVPAPIAAENIPVAEMKEAIGFSNIDNPGDVFVIMRYHLQVSLANTPDTQWCTEVFLENDTGCDLTPSNPEYPFSLKEDLYLLFYGMAHHFILVVCLKHSNKHLEYLEYIMD